MHFLAVCRPKFQTFSLRCLPWGHPTEPLSYANSKETESLGENGCRQRCVDKSLYKDVYVNSFFPCTARPWNALPLEYWGSI